MLWDMVCVQRESDVHMAKLMLTKLLNTRKQRDSTAAALATLEELEQVGEAQGESLQRDGPRGREGSVCICVGVVGGRSLTYSVIPFQ
mgnify:CR=1 FL=1